MELKAVAGQRAHGPQDAWVAAVREGIRLRGDVLDVRDLSGEQCAQLLKDLFADIYEATIMLRPIDLLVLEVHPER
jgi:hypothetical protein